MTDSTNYFPDISAQRAAIGRPSKYTPAACGILMDAMSHGKSKTSVAAILGVHRDTLYEWGTKHPAFSDALRHGEQLCESFWLQICIDESLGIPGAQVKGGAIMAMRNVLKWETRDKVEMPGAELIGKSVLAMREMMSAEEYDKKFEPGKGVNDK